MERAFKRILCTALILFAIMVYVFEVQRLIHLNLSMNTDDVFVCIVKGSVELILSWGLVIYINRRRNMEELL